MRLEIFVSAVGGCNDAISGCNAALKGLKVLPSCFLPEDLQRVNIWMEKIYDLINKFRMLYNNDNLICQ